MLCRLTAQAMPGQGGAVRARTSATERAPQSPVSRFRNAQGQLIPCCRTSEPVPPDHRFIQRTSPRRAEPDQIIGRHSEVDTRERTKGEHASHPIGISAQSQELSRGVPALVVIEVSDLLVEDVHLVANKVVRVARPHQTSEHTSNIEHNRSPARRGIRLPLAKQERDH